MRRQRVAVAVPRSTPSRRASTSGTLSNLIYVKIPGINKYIPMTRVADTTSDQYVVSVEDPAKGIGSVVRGTSGRPQFEWTATTPPGMAERIDPYSKTSYRVGKPPADSIWRPVGMGQVVGRGGDKRTRARSGAPRQQPRQPQQRQQQPRQRQGPPPSPSSSYRFQPPDFQQQAGVPVTNYQQQQAIFQQQQQAIQRQRQQQQAISQQRQEQERQARLRRDWEEQQRQIRRQQQQQQGQQQQRQEQQRREQQLLDLEARRSRQQEILRQQEQQLAREQQQQFEHQAAMELQRATSERERQQLLLEQAKRRSQQPRGMLLEFADDARQLALQSRLIRTEQEEIEDALKRFPQEDEPRLLRRQELLARRIQSLRQRSDTLALEHQARLEENALRDEQEIDEQVAAYRKQLESERKRKRIDTANELERVRQVTADEIQRVRQEFELADPDLERQRLQQQVTQLSKRARELGTLAERIEEGEMIANTIVAIGQQGSPRTISELPSVLPEGFRNFFIGQDFAAIPYGGVPIDTARTILTAPQQYELLCFFLNQYLEQRLKLQPHQFRMACV